MKKVWVILLTACIGTGVGWGWTVVERMTHRDSSFSIELATRSGQVVEEQRVIPSQKGAKLELVDGDVYEFGSMERMSKQRHTFRIRSVGDAPLTLKVARSSCKCTVSGISGEQFPPGSTADIEVEWTGQMPLTGTEFQQTVDVATNDPDHDILTLVISGYVTESIRVVPEEIVAGRFSADTGTQTEFRLFAFRSEKLEILETGFEDPESAAFFDVSYEPLPAEEYGKEKGAICGLLGKLEVKSGLPLGPINQTIRIRAHADEDVTLYVPIRGLTTGDILVASSDVFEANRSLLDFGPLKRDGGASAVLQVFVKGEHRQATGFSVGKIEPEGYLRVHVGDAEELNNGKTLRYQVTIEIPPGLEPINRMGGESATLGRVVLETTHPTMKQVPINVRFAIEN